MKHAEHGELVDNVKGEKLTRAHIDQNKNDQVLLRGSKTFV